MEALPIMIISLVVYFIPTIIAVSRHKENVVAIFALNFLTGWTFLGWIGSLVWALTTDL